MFLEIIIINRLIAEKAAFCRAVLSQPIAMDEIARAVELGCDNLAHVLI